jgi:hypothetical protein
VNGNEKSPMGESSVHRDSKKIANVSAESEIPVCFFFYLKELSIVDMFIQGILPVKNPASTHGTFMAAHFANEDKCLTGQWIVYLDTAQTPVSQSVERFWAKKKDGR